MSKRPTPLQHFRSFVYQNNITDFNVALEYFTDEKLMLLQNEDFSSLLNNLSEKDLLVYKNKKY